MSGAVASAPAQGRPSVAAPLGTSWRPLFEGPRPPTRLRASAATAVRARARADLELVTHLRIGASGRCARKPWIQAACFAASAPELGLAGWLPRLLGTVLCEFPLGECGACACYEARLFFTRRLELRAGRATAPSGVGGASVSQLGLDSAHTAPRRKASGVPWRFLSSATARCAAGPEPYFIRTENGVSLGRLRKQSALCSSINLLEQ